MGLDLVYSLLIFLVSLNELDDDMNASLAAQKTVATEVHQIEK